MTTIGTIRDHVTVERTEDGARIHVTEDGRHGSIALTADEARRIAEALTGGSA